MPNILFALDMLNILAQNTNKFAIQQDFYQKNHHREILKLLSPNRKSVQFLPADDNSARMPQTTSNETDGSGLW